MNLIANIPLDTDKIAGLLQDRDDLFLVWPAAKYPFDHGQWKEVLNPEKGNKSFLVYQQNELIGQCSLLATANPDALVITNDAETYMLGFLYLQPQCRSQGLGVKMIDGALAGLTARAVIIIDEQDQITYTQC